jgi:hypothetical protein
MGGWNETCLTKLAAWMNGWNQVLVGVETYDCGARTDSFWAGGATSVYDDVEDADETDEQEEKTESLSELELPDEVEYWGKGSSQVGGE